MKTPRQMLIDAGFKRLSKKFQVGYTYDYYGIVKDGRVLYRAGLDTVSWYKYPRAVMVEVAGKKRVITSPFKNYSYQWTQKQADKLEALIKQSLAAGPAPEKEKKPRPPSPMKGVKMSDEQKAENLVWRWIGEFTVVGFIDKEMQKRLYYIKGAKYIRIEDYDCVMAYANIRDEDLKEIDMTIGQLEEFLVSKGVPKKTEKRTPKPFVMYD